MHARGASFSAHGASMSPPWNRARPCVGQKVALQERTSMLVGGHRQRLDGSVAARIHSSVDTMHAKPSSHAPHHHRLRDACTAEPQAQACARKPGKADVCDHTAAAGWPWVMQRHAMPCHAAPCHAAPCHAMMPPHCSAVAGGASHATTKEWHGRGGEGGSAASLCCCAGCRTPTFGAAPA